MLQAVYLLPHPPVSIPDIGKLDCEKMSETISAMNKICGQIAVLKPDTILLISPHSVVYSDYIHVSPGKEAQGDLSSFGSSFETTVYYDESLRVEILDAAAKKGVYCGTLGEKSPKLDHGTLVPLFFIQKYHTDFELIRIASSGLYDSDLYKFGLSIKEVAEKSDKKIIVVASGDLSHKLKSDGPYGFSQSGVELDKKIIKAISEANFLDLMTFDNTLVDEAAECGLKSLIIACGALDKTNVISAVHSYEAPFGVGYAVCSLLTDSQNENRDFLTQLENYNSAKIKSIRQKQSDYCSLAQNTLEAEFKRETKSFDSTDAFFQKSGVFVCIKKFGELRGCVGTVLPVCNNIYEEIKKHTIAAAFHDNRFEPVLESELDHLTYTVDVLSAPFKADINELDPIKFGVIVSSGKRRGVLLPNLAGINTVEKQLETVLKKAGIAANEKYTLEKFEVSRFN